MPTGPEPPCQQRLAARSIMERPTVPAEWPIRGNCPRLSTSTCQSHQVPPARLQWTIVCSDLHRSRRIDRIGNRSRTRRGMCRPECSSTEASRMVANSRDQSDPKGTARRRAAWGLSGCSVYALALLSSRGIRPWFWASQASNVCSEGFNVRATSRLRAPQKTSWKSCLN